MLTGLVLLQARCFAPLNAVISLRESQKEQGKNLELGNLEIVTSEFLGGKIFASSCGPKGVLTLISDPDINIGLIRLILKRSGDELKEILSEFLAESPEMMDSGLDLSDLDELTPD